MSNTTIHQVLGIGGTTLIVFYTQAHCWQFRLISPGGAVFGERKIYYSAEAALKAGVDCSRELEKGATVFTSTLTSQPLPQDSTPPKSGDNHTPDLHKHKLHFGSSPLPYAHHRYFHGRSTAN